MALSKQNKPLGEAKIRKAGFKDRKVQLGWTTKTKVEQQGIQGML